LAAERIFAEKMKKLVFILGVLLSKNGLEHVGKVMAPLGERNGVRGDGITWLKGVSFSTGALEIDLRGKDVFQQSFLGLVFHGVDTSTYEIIYFRPFNFRTADTVRRGHAVQYCSMPGYDWYRLRSERPGQFEHAVVPAPLPDAWFHARIEVDEREVRVYVDHAQQPSLVVKRLSNRKDGRIGLWSTFEGELGDFANLVIEK
jgi:hypothetical protein